MRGFHWAAVVAWSAAVACGGGEFTSQDPDASMSGSSAGVGGAGTTDISTVATGGSTTVGSSGGAGGSNSGTTAAGGGAGRDAGSDAGGGGAGGVGGAGGGGGTPRNSGDCERPSDCGGDPCIELYPGGYRVCVAKVPEATMCSLPQGQCCKSADCGGDARAPGKCVAGPVEPYCGGPQMLPTNVCATDACTSAADCSGANAICVPSGALGRKAAARPRLHGRAGGHLRSGRQPLL
jgi:hypothetical protein